MNLGDFHEEVRDALGRGTALDAQITSYTRRAARWIERNASYKYMEKYASMTFNSAAAFPHVIDFPSPQIKHMIMFRYTANAEFVYLRRINPKDQTSLDVAAPQGYWLAGMSKILLDSKPDEDYDAEVLYAEFTAWPTSLTATHWLLDNADDLMLAQTLFMMAPWIKDADLLQAMKIARDDAIRTIEGARIDLEESDTDDSMVYGGGP